MHTFRVLKQSMEMNIMQFFYISRGNIGSFFLSYEFFGFPKNGNFFDAVLSNYVFYKNLIFLNKIFNTLEISFEFSFRKRRTLTRIKKIHIMYVSLVTGHGWGRKLKKLIFFLNFFHQNFIFIQICINSIRINIFKLTIVR